MPLTPLQREVLLLLARHRHPESHVGGGAAINRAEDSPRFSSDLDIFHDLADTVHASAQADAAVLEAEGFAVEWSLQQPYLRRAKVIRAGQELRLDWCFDSAFRFFPVEPDPDFGFCLHRADLATNKALALAGRQEVRDFLDILYLHQTYLSLGAIFWAACGKDQGFTPWSLLDMAKRHVRFRNGDLENANLEQENLARPLSLVDLKQHWHQAVTDAEALFARLPAAEAGCFYLTSSGKPFTPDPSAAHFAEAVRHFGSLRGAWPQVS